MAELDSLTLRIEANAANASTGIEQLIGSLNSLQGAVQPAVSALQEVQTALAQLSSSPMRGAEQSIQRTTSSIGSLFEGVRDRVSRVMSNVVTYTATGVKSTVGTIGKAAKAMGKHFGESTGKTLEFARALGRIATYRFLRSLIKNITQGASQGLQNLAHASKEANATLSQLSSASLTMKNALGGALYSALAPLIGILTSIANAAVYALNAISMLFAILGGRATFKKATSATDKFGKSLGGAAGGAKALKQELMGFDEINSLSPDSGGGGGGGGGGLDYGSMFEEAPVSQWLKDMVDAANFAPLGEMIADKINKALAGIDWASIQNKARRLAQSLTTLINGFASKIDGKLIGKTIAEAINTATTFVAHFWDDTNWKLLGQKAHDALLEAFRTINAFDLAHAITGKVKASILFVNAMLPKNAEEWKVIGTKIKDVVIESINNIPWSEAGDIVGKLLLGAISTAKTLADAGTLTKIADGIKTAIKSALGQITKEDIQAAVDSVLADIKDAISILLSIKIEIGPFKDVSLVGAALTGMTLWGAIKRVFTGLLKNPSVRSLNGALAVAGIIGVALTIEPTIESFKQLSANLSTGTATPQDWASFISNVFKLLGFAALTVDPGLGTGLLVISFTIQPIIDNILPPKAQGLDLGWVAGVFGEDFENNLYQATSAANSLRELRDVFAEFSGVDIDVSQFEKLISVTSGIDASTADIETLRTSVSDLFGIFATISTSTGDDWSAFIERIMSGSSDAASSVSEIGSAANEAKSAIDGISDSGAGSGANGISKLFSGIKDKVSGVASNIKAFAENKKSVSDMTSGLDGAASAADSATNALKATGEQADDVKTKIVEIPSEVVFNIKFGNYDDIIKKIDNLKKKISSVGGASARITVKAGLSQGAKNFLNSLKLIDSSVQNRVDNLIAASEFRNGGFPAAGSLYWANENGIGSELIGQIGNQHAVANSDQIGDVLLRYMENNDNNSNDGLTADAIGAAVAAYIKGTGLGAVYLDGKMLAHSINRETRRSGRPAITF